MIFLEMLGIAFCIVLAWGIIFGTMWIVITVQLSKQYIEELEEEVKELKRRLK